MYFGIDNADTGKIISNPIFQLIYFEKAAYQY